MAKKVVRRLEVMYNIGKPYTCHDECPQIIMMGSSNKYLCGLKHGTKEGLNLHKKNEEDIILLRTNYCLELFGKT